MSQTEPIADMLTVIRNGLMANKNTITVPHSVIKTGILKVLKTEGYISGFDVLDTKPAKSIKVVCSRESAGLAVPFGAFYKFPCCSKDFQINRVGAIKVRLSTKLRRGHKGQIYNQYMM